MQDATMSQESSLLPSPLGAVAASAVFVVVGDDNVVLRCWAACVLVVMSVSLVLKHGPSLRSHMVGPRHARLVNSCMPDTVSPQLKAVSRAGVHSFCPSRQSAFGPSTMVADRLLTVVRVLMLVMLVMLVTIVESIFVLDGHIFERVAAGVFGGGASRQFAKVAPVLIIRNEI
jgi:hypothetical protein